MKFFAAVLASVLARAATTVADDTPARNLRAISTFALQESGILEPEPAPIEAPIPPPTVFHPQWTSSKSSTNSSQTTTKSTNSSSEPINCATILILVTPMSKPASASTAFAMMYSKVMNLLKKETRKQYANVPSLLHGVSKRFA